MKSTRDDREFADEADELVDLFVGLFDDYVAALQGPGLSREAQRRAERAFERYVETLQEPWEDDDLRERAEDAYEAYTDALQRAASRPDVRQRFEDAYVHYLEDLRDAWASSDGHQLDPVALGTVAESMTAVAAIAAAASRATPRAKRSADEASAREEDGSWTGSRQAAKPDRRSARGGAADAPPARRPKPRASPTKRQ
jgi:hypothetical protein